MAKLIFSAALAASLLAATSASAGPTESETKSLIEEWLIEGGMRTMLVDADARRDGTRLVWLLLHCFVNCGCPYEKDSMGGNAPANEIAGLVISGSDVRTDLFLACATSEKLVKDCAAEASYDTQFRGTISADGKRIHGEYHADGWGFVEQGDIWTNCHADQDFEAWLPVDITWIGIKKKKKLCGPGVDKGFVFITPRSGKAALYQAESTSSPVVSKPPTGTRLVYTQVSTENGQTWYYVNPPSATPGWAPAADVSCDRPIPLPPKKLHLDPNEKIVVGTMAYTAAARG